MIETFAALLFAHVLADFVLQTDWIVANKRKPHVLLFHGGIVWVTLVLSVGSLTAWPLFAVAVAHIIIDAVKAYAPVSGLRPYLVDQAAHFATLIAIAVYFPTLWADGAWGAYTWLLPIMTLFSGFVLAVRAGSFAIGFLMAPWADEHLPAGLEKGGQLIGALERGLVFLLIMVGQPAGVGFLIAAKSILRFDTAKGDQRAAEYVIIGTLASFGWALAWGYATLAMLTFQPPLGILPPLP